MGGFTRRKVGKNIFKSLVMKLGQGATERAYRREDYTHGGG